MAIFTLGIDIGSTASKCAIIMDGKDIVSTAVVFNGAGTEGPENSLNEALDKAKLGLEDIAFIVATGYGRNIFEKADDQISELSCHAKGAVFLFPNVKTIIDIGGQDAKAIKIGTNGKMSNFLMNDKCAAGTGRFLEVMSRVLNIPIENFAEASHKSTEKIDISSTCTVFAESEVISYLAKAVKREDILAGVHRSVAGKVGNLAARVGVEDDVIMTGGVALDVGMVEALEQVIDTKIYTNEYCQLNGSIGAAVYAYELFNKEQKEEKDKAL